MNPDKKRKTSPIRSEDDDEDDDMMLHQRAANRGYKNIMATDCSDEDKIQSIFFSMEPLAAGLLRQRFVEEETQYNRDKEEFESKTRENEKVKKVLKSFEAPTVSSSVSRGGGGGIMGMLTGKGSKK